MLDRIELLIMTLYRERVCVHTGYDDPWYIELLAATRAKG